MLPKLVITDIDGVLYVFCSTQYLEWKKKFDIKIVGNLVWLINRFL